MISFAPEIDDDFDENLLKQIDATKPLRDLFFDYVESLIISDINSGSVLGDFFEQVYNATYSIDDKRSSYNDVDFEFSKFLIWEMFIGTTAILLHNEQYAVLHSMLNRTYFLKESVVESSIKPVTYVKFRTSSRYLEGSIKRKSTTPGLFTLAGDIIIKREKLPVIKKETLANADLVLYQLSCVYYDFPDNLHHRDWFPSLYVYTTEYAQQPLWSKMVSRKHCEKLFPLFGITDITQLKIMVEKNQPNEKIRYSGAWESAPSILQSIEPEKIGIMP